MNSSVPSFIEILQANTRAENASDHELLQLFIQCQQVETKDAVLLKAVLEEMKRRSLS